MNGSADTNTTIPESRNASSAKYIVRLHYMSAGCENTAFIHCCALIVSYFIDKIELMKPTKFEVRARNIVLLRVAQIKVIIKWSRQLNLPDRATHRSYRFSLRMSVVDDQSSFDR